MKRLRMPAALIGLLLTSALPPTSWAQVPSDFASPRIWRWPTELGGIAHEIQLDTKGQPVVSTVPTTFPVVTYGGKSSDGQLLAYLPLATLDLKAPLGRTYVPAEDLRQDSASELVPTGELIIEDGEDRTYRRIDLPGHYVISVAWSPIDPKLLAYTYSSGSAFGVAILDVDDPTPIIIEKSATLADYIRWSPTGTGLDYYKRDPSGGEISANGYIEPVFRERRYSIENDKSSAPSEVSSWPFQLPRLKTLKSPDSSPSQGFSVFLAGSHIVRGNDILGLSKISLATSEGEQVISVPAHKLVAGVSTGVVFKKFTGEAAELLFLSLNGRLNVLNKATATAYKLPFHHSYSPDMTVTQVGQSLSTKCSVSSHTGNLSYAYDMQAKIGNEAILVAGDGTVAYIHKSVTCNSMDTVGCTDYSSSCSSTASNGGWGNTVIIQHADGTWTKYTHLRHGSVVPTTVGRSAGIGCQLGSEGHTGATSGNKNGCGDHLHFQRQTSSSRDGASTPISFTDVVTPLSCSSYESQNAGRSCAF